MSIIDQIRTQGAAVRITEEILYAEVLREMEQGIRRDGLWAQAMSSSNMQENEALAKYITLRVQSIKDEISLLKKQIKQTKEPKEQTPHKEVENRKPKPEQNSEFANYGFGFIFIGFIANIILFGISAKFDIINYIYNPWWLGYLAISAIFGFCWVALKKSFRL